MLETQKIVSRILDGDIPATPENLTNVIDNQQPRFYNTPFNKLGVIMQKEIWLQHPIYQRLEISNRGRIRHFKDKSKKYCNINDRGYYSFIVKVQGKKIHLKLHRLVAELFLEPPSAELVEECSKTHHGVVLVNHKDGNKLNNNIENLEWCTSAQNNKHMWEHGLVEGLKGSSNGRSKLVEDDVHTICKLFEEGKTIEEVCEDFPNISRKQIGKIRSNHAWKHIRSLYNIPILRRTRFNDQS